MDTNEIIDDYGVESSDSIADLSDSVSDLSDLSDIISELSIEFKENKEDEGEGENIPNWITTRMLENLLPVTYDYIRLNLDDIEIVYDQTEILRLKIAEQWNLKREHFSCSDPEHIKNFLCHGKYIKLMEGILCGGFKNINGERKDFIIIMSALSRRADRGRIYILNHDQEISA